MNAAPSWSEMLTRIYGADIDEVIAWGRSAAARLGGLLDDDGRVDQLDAAVADLAAARDVAAQHLTGSDSGRRQNSRPGSPLNWPSSRCPHTVVAVEVRPRHVRARRVPMTWRSVCDHTPAACCAPLPDRPPAMNSPGSCSPSRVAIAQAVPGPPTFVFDEIDAGIGGRAALAVGARLAQLARHSQVIVVTHLAQVAAHADRHLVVRKSDDGHVIPHRGPSGRGAARLGNWRACSVGPTQRPHSNTHVTSWTGWAVRSSVRGRMGRMSPRLRPLRNRDSTMRGQRCGPGRQTHEEPDQAASARGDRGHRPHRPRQGQRRGLGCLSTGSRHQRRSVDQWSLSQSRAGNPRRCGHPAARQCGQGVMERLDEGDSVHLEGNVLLSGVERICDGGPPG